MKIFLIFLATLLNITLLYIGQYYPFIIGLFLWFTLWFYSPSRGRSKNKINNENLNPKTEEDNEKIKLYELLMIFYVFGQNINLVKNTPAWKKINIKYDDYIIKDALRISDDNVFSLFKKYDTEVKDNQKFYFICELINLRHDSHIYIKNKQKDPIIKLIKFCELDFLKKRELIDKAYHYLLEEEPFNERVQRNAEKIHNTVKNSIKASEEKKILEALSLFDFNSVEEVDEILLKKRYKVLLSQNHPDKHHNADEAQRKSLEYNFIKLQENYNFIYEKMFSH